VGHSLALQRPGNEEVGCASCLRLLYSKQSRETCRRIRVGNTAKVLMSIVYPRPRRCRKGANVQLVEWRFSYQIKTEKKGT